MFLMTVLSLQLADAPRGSQGFSSLAPLSAGVSIILIFVINTESPMCQIPIQGPGGPFLEEPHKRVSRENWDAGPPQVTAAVVLKSEGHRVRSSSQEPLKQILTLAGSSRTINWSRAIQGGPATGNTSRDSFPGHVKERTFGPGCTSPVSWTLSRVFRELILASFLQKACLCPTAQQGRSDLLVLPMKSGRNDKRTEILEPSDVPLCAVFPFFESLPPPCPWRPKMQFEKVKLET